LLLLFTTAAKAAEIQELHGHVPAAVTKFNLQPVGRLPSSNRLHLSIGLPLRNQQEFNGLLHDIYDPGSTNFHHYLTPDQIAEMFGPTKEDYQSVIDFAQTNGLKVVGTYAHRLVLDVSGKVPDIERALQVTIWTYQHPTESRTFYATDVEPSVDVKLPILDISGLDNYNLPRSALHKIPDNGSATCASGSQPSGAFWGSDFRNAYVPGVTLNGSGQIVGLVDWTNGYYASDITGYEKSNSLPNVTLGNVLLDNASGVPSGDTGEASLDIEMAIAMAPNLAGVYIFEGDVWNDILSSMASYNQIKQLSSSWSFGGFNSTSDNLLQIMAMQGQSFFLASGDGDAYVGSFGWPSDDTNVISVGGTSLTMNGLGASYGSETVWNSGPTLTCDGWCCNPSPCGNTWWGSGGGTSTTYLIPSWQQSVSMSINGGSTAKRNVPDIAMVASGVWVIYSTNYAGVERNGLGGSATGTSIAAPLWAGFTALVNQQANANGAASVGFLNPALYTIGLSSLSNTAFHDITTGSNEWSGSPHQYIATNGYDLCTGWGTPNGANMINALAAGIPAAPSFLTATVLTSSTIKLTWQDNSSNELGFKIEHATAIDGPWTLIDTVGANVTARNVTSSDTCSYYRVRSFNAACDSAPSNIVGSPPPYHLADTDHDWKISLSEYLAFGACWRDSNCRWPVIGTVNLSWYLNAGYLWRTTPFAYHYAGSTPCAQCPPNAPSVCWAAGQTAGAAAANKASEVSESATTGDASIAGERVLPSQYTPGIPIQVSIIAHPSVGNRGWAVEETTPTRWVVTDLGGGHWTEGDHTIRFGAYDDETDRVLTYTVIPADSTNITEGLSGRLGVADSNHVVVVNGTGGAATISNAVPCATCDFDGTGQNNLFKYVAGLDPTNPASVFTLNVASVSDQPSQIRIFFNPLAPGRTYSPQFSTDLVSGVWLPLTTYVGPVTNNGNQVTITDTNPIPPQEFYRINISLP
jgi:hypothetical protein